MPYVSTVTGSRSFPRGTPSSPVGNCMYLPSIYDIQLNAICIDFYRVQAISTRDAIISSGKLYVFKCLMHLLTIVYVNIEICCKCWYCWFFFLTFTCSRPCRRGTPSSPVENCMYLPSIYDIKLNALCIDFYRVQIISTRDAIISSGKLYLNALCIS